MRAMDSSRTVALTVGAAFREGAVETAPIVAGIIPFGLVAGAAAAEAGLGLDGAMSLSMLVFAGASQLAAIALFDNKASTTSNSGSDTTSIDNELDLHITSYLVFLVFNLAIKTKMCCPLPPLF